MNQRVEVQDLEQTGALKLLADNLTKRLVSKGRMGFISIHEILGAVEEEMDELKDAVRSDDRTQVVDELLDVAIGCVFGVASILAIMRQERADAAAAKAAPPAKPGTPGK